MDVLNGATLLGPGLGAGRRRPRAASPTLELRLRTAANTAVWQRQVAWSGKRSLLFSRLLRKRLWTFAPSEHVRKELALHSLHS